MFNFKVMAKINFNLKETKEGKPTPVVIVIRWNNKILKYSSGETIDPIFWNYEDQQANTSKPKEGAKNSKGKKFIEHPEFNRKLDNYKTDINNLFRSFENGNNRVPEPNEFRELLNLEFQRTAKQEPDSLISFAQKFKDEAKYKVNEKTGNTYAAKTLTSYKQVRDLLIEFSKTKKRQVDFKDIDFEFYTDFVKFMTIEKNYSVNSIGKHIKTLKTILNEATERGINENVKFKSKKFKVVKQPTDSIYLTIDELKEIEKIDFSNKPKFDKVRDLFLVGCYTGLRFSDFSNIKDHNIKGDIIEIETKKTGVKVAVPVHPVVRSILTKYKGEVPKSLSNQKMNDYIKLVCKEVKSLQKIQPKKENKGGLTYSTNYQKFDLVTTHTARRSFASNNFLSGVPAQVLMKITGHKTEAAFLGYIKISPPENAEILKLHWEKLSNLKVS